MPASGEASEAQASYNKQATTSNSGGNSVGSKDARSERLGRKSFAVLHREIEDKQKTEKDTTHELNL